MELEAEIGSLTDHASYVRYVRGLAAFRGSLEPALAGWAANLPDFQMTVLSDLLARDLDDLGLDAVSPQAPPAIANMPDALGALYVLEGSALGARVLVKQVAPLGLNETFGARHLSRQAGSLTAWRRLVALLDTGEPSFAAATETFQFAHACMKQARHG